jgi:tRNA A37 methylthiotransferase MiaB
LGCFKKLDITIDNEVVDCVIVYPGENSEDFFKTRELKEESIFQFTKFYKYRIKLPLK